MQLNRVINKKNYVKTSVNNYGLLDGVTNLPKYSSENSLHWLVLTHIFQLLYATEFEDLYVIWGHAVAQLRHCFTSRRDAGWIPDGVIGIFH